jgi:hypothetical protein
MDAALVSGWMALCQLLSPAFTQPTFITFLHIATGWTLCRSRPTVTNLVCTTGSSLLGQAARHWTVYEKFFYRAAWSLSDLSRLLLTRIVVPLIDRDARNAPAEGEASAAEGEASAIDVNIDDTTCGRCGKHVAWAGYFKDASVSNTLKTVVHWAHNWGVACVTMRDPRWPRRVIGLPVWFELYRKPKDCDRSHPFLTRQQVAARMIHEVRDALPGRTIRIAADGQYATGHVVQAAAEAQSNLVSRIRSDAAIYQLAPVALIVQTLVKAWYLLHGADAARAQPRGAEICGWLRPKDHPSYLDMLATLRSVLWTHRLKCNSTLAGRVRKLLEPLRFTLCAAA